MASRGSDQKVASRYQQTCVWKAIVERAILVASLVSKSAVERTGAVPCPWYT